MPVGILQCSLDPDQPGTSFQLASQAGADGMELACASDKQADAMLSEEAVAQVAQWKQQYGLQVPGIALAVLSQTESLFGKPKVAEAADRLIRRALATAKAIGAETVILPFLGKATIEFDPELDRVIDALPELAEEAEQADLTLGIECTLNVNQQLHLLEHLSMYASVKACYDTGCALVRRLDPATFLRDLGPGNICQIHFRDVRLGEDGRPPEWNVALGEGDVDFSAVASAIAAMSYEGWIVLETPATDDPLAAAKVNMQFARHVLAQR